jgi:NADH-quinone oxidoreductase subunit N
MNLALLSHEWLVIALGLGVLLADLWLPAPAKRQLGYVAALGVGAILLYSLLAFTIEPGDVQYAFNKMYVLDGLALFFKRFFLVAALLVLLMSVEYADSFQAGIGEFYALVLFALSGMLFASSVNDFAFLFVSLELITVTFYVLTSFQRTRLTSLEAGVKYLIIGALSTSFTVFGIALVYGISHQLNFGELAAVAGQYRGNRLFLCGLVLVMVGLGFKIAAFPFQIWAPDVYQGAPSPTTAFLAVGSKAAGFVLLLRVLFTAMPAVTAQWSNLLIVVSAVTILYGNLCAIPQRNIKRLLGYSSIAHAGYMLLGIAALAVSLASHGGGQPPTAGASAVLYYLSGYLFTVLGAFTVICLVLRQVEGEDIAALAGLNQRSPLLAATMALAMVSLAGIPPLAGFFGKFLLLKSVITEAPAHPGYYCLAFTAVAGVIISLYYYFGVVRAMYWSRETSGLSPIPTSVPIRLSLYACAAGMLFLGLCPAPMVRCASQAVQGLGLPAGVSPGASAPKKTPNGLAFSHPASDIPPINLN